MSIELSVLAGIVCMNLHGSHDKPMEHKPTVMCIRDFGSCMRMERKKAKKSAEYMHTQVLNNSITKEEIYSVYLHKGIMVNECNRRIYNKHHAR